jgi:hypothetical protein
MRNHCSFSSFIIMHSKDEKPLLLLIQLLRLNTDRFLGYQKAARQTPVSVLQVLFERLTITSATCSEELCAEIYKIGGQPDLEKCRSQCEISWKEIQQALLIDDHAALMDACYHEELMSYKVYEYALRYASFHLTTQQIELCTKHLDLLRNDYTKVQNLRMVLLNAA